MWRFGSDPEDAAPAAVLRALHRRGVGTLLRVTTSPSHVALTVAVSGDQCTLVFATTPDAPPRDAVEDVATALSESAEAGAVVLRLGSRRFALNEAAASQGHPDPGEVLAEGADPAPLLRACAPQVASSS